MRGDRHRVPLQRVRGLGFGVKFTNTNTLGQAHTYSVYWRLTVKAVDAGGKPVAGAAVAVADKDGKEVFKKNTGADGVLSEELLEYRSAVEKPEGPYKIERTYSAPYKVKVGEREQTVTLDRNTEITVQIMR